MVAELRPLLAPHMGMKVKRRYQTVLSNYLDLYHKLPDSGERHYKSDTRKRRFDAYHGGRAAATVGPQFDLT